jgi:hypothetical protein
MPPPPPLLLKGEAVAHLKTYLSELMQVPGIDTGCACEMIEKDVRLLQGEQL